ncbi:ABC transporter [Paenibacillus dendritiformis]|nr:ABC transporter [Paenibacillus dendritiformis]
MMYSFSNIWHGSRFAILYIWRLHKPYFYVSIALHLALGLLPLLSVWTMQELVNEVILIAQPGHGFATALSILSFQMVIILSAYILQFFSQLNDQKLENLLGLVLKKQIFGKIMNLPYSTFEDPSFYDQNQRIINSHFQIVSMVKTIMSLGSTIVTVLSLVGYITNIHWGLLVIIFVFSIPILMIHIRFGNKRYVLTRFLTPYHRREMYISDLLSQRDSLKEIRLFGLGSHLIEKWSSFYKRSAQEKYNLSKNQGIWELAGSMLLTLTYIVSGILIIFLISAKRIEIGAFVAALQSIQNIQSSLTEISASLSNMYEISLYIEDFKTFQQKKELESSSSHIKCGAIHQISVQNLTFTYPNQTKPTLKNIHLSIKKGQKVVIIGENGSGKTSLIKCMLGLYETGENTICVNQIPLRSYDIASYHQRIAALFQDFIEYEFSARENIGFGNLNNPSKSEMIAAARKTKIHEHIAKLPERYESLLGRHFEGGHELSGGQWQKLALSRALFKNSDLIILDEPTSSMDPESELDIIHELFQGNNDKAVLIITHRLGVAVQADYILVMREGRIVEEGTHQELLRRQGEYHRLYRAQTKIYNQESGVLV